MKGHRYVLDIRTSGMNTEHIHHSSSNNTAVSPAYKTENKIGEKLNEICCKLISYLRKQFVSLFILKLRHLSDKAFSLVVLTGYICKENNVLRLRTLKSLTFVWITKKWLH